MLWLALSSLLPAQAGGQASLLHEWMGEYLGDEFGDSVDFAGDVNLNGFADIIVGADTADPGGVISAGSAFLYSGKDGSLLFRFNGTQRAEWLGWSVAGAGDVDGDGHPDVIVGAPGALANQGFASVYSGADGRLLHQFNGSPTIIRSGWSVDGAGDVNADGHADLIVGAPSSYPGGLTRAGSAFVYSGADGSLLYRFDGAGFDTQLGWAVAGVGDLNRDGHDDVTVSAPGADPGGSNRPGTVFVYSGADGGILLQREGLAPRDFFGTSLDGLSDVDGDDVPDILIGAELVDVQGIEDVGAVYVISGGTGQTLHLVEGMRFEDLFGHSVAGVGDLTGDGVPEFLVGAIGYSGSLYAAGYSHLYSGFDATLLWRVEGSLLGDNLGYSVAGGQDADGDGRPDLVIGAPQSHILFPGNGKAYVYAFDPFLSTDRPELSISAQTAATLAIEFPFSEAGRRYALLASVTGTGPTTLAGLAIPLTPDPAFQLMAAGQAPKIFTAPYGTLDAGGKATAQLRAPALHCTPPWLGRLLYLAAVSYDPGLAPRLSSSPVGIRAAP